MPPLADLSVTVEPLLPEHVDAMSAQIHPAPYESFRTEPWSQWCASIPDPDEFLAHALVVKCQGEPVMCLYRRLYQPYTDKIRIGWHLIPAFSEGVARRIVLSTALDAWRSHHPGVGVVAEFHAWNTVAVRNMADHGFVVIGTGESEQGPHTIMEIPVDYPLSAASPTHD